MNDANELFQSASYADYLSDFTVTERVALVQAAKSMLSQCNLDVLQPFQYEFKQPQLRVAQFIHDRVLWKKPLLDAKTLSFTLDPATESQPLSDFLNDIGELAAYGISLSLPSSTLKILNELKPVNLNHKSVQFLAVLLDTYPEVASYDTIAKHLDMDATDKRSIYSQRSEFIDYIKTLRYSARAISHLKKHLQTEENLGYKLVK